MIRTLIHLVRHAEVENPHNIWYGRLEGFALSPRGLRQIEALAEYFAARPIQAVYSSPLTRAMQTALAIAATHNLEVATDEDIIESEAKLQGRQGGHRLLRNPFNARHFLNPLRPSWGEPYASVRYRMNRAIHRMRADNAGGEVVAVSHMTPLLVARLAAEKNPRPPWLAGLPCARASITTLEFEGDEYRSTAYLPVGSAVL